MTGIGILGLVSIIGDDGEPMALRAVRRRALLAVLTARHGQTVDTDVLIDVLWPDRLPDHPEAALQSQIHHLRRQLGPLGPTVVTEEDGYRLTCPPDAVDALRFERLVSGDTLADIDAALGLWRGPAFGDLAGDVELRPAAERLEGLRADATERRVELLLRAGRDAEAEDAAATLALHQPYREGPVALQMRALARLGRHVDGLHVFAEFRHRMVEELGVEPSPSLRAVERELLTHDSTPAVGVPGDSFVGRHDELTASVELLRRVRLVTLTGPGGVGKSRLALHAAAAIADRFPGGVVLCELAPVGRPEAVVGAVASTLGLDDRAGRDLSTRVVEYLRGVPTLLVLDNCEHVLDTTAELVELVLSRTADAVVLATSRHRLGVPGEHVVAVDTLGVADDGAAIDLFNDRAAAVRPGVDMSGDNGAAVTDIVRLLGGLPLAIELAAARTLTRTPTELLAELHAGAAVGERRRIDRHRSVDATIDWSYELLSADEQTVYRKMAVFAGGWTPAAAGAVAADTGRHVDALVEHSLVVARTVEGRTRFAMLEPVRQHAAARLLAAGEVDETRARHAEWAATFMETADAGLRTAEEARSARRRRPRARQPARRSPLGARPRAGFGAADHRRPVLVRLLPRAGRGVRVGRRDDRAPPRRGSDRRRRIGDRRAGRVASWRSDAIPPTRRARHRPWASAGHALRLDRTTERRRARRRPARCARAPRCRRRPGARGRRHRARGPGTCARCARPRLPRSTRRGGRGGQRARQLLDAADNPSIRAMCAYVAGEMLVEAAPDRALAHLQESRAIAHEVGNDFVAAIAGTSAVSSAARVGDPVVALGEYRDVISSFRRGGAWPQLWTTLRTLVETLSRVGSDGDAAVILGAVRATGSGAPIRGADAERLGAVEAALRARLGGPRYEALFAEGDALGDEAAVTRALAAVDAVT